MLPHSALPATAWITARGERGFSSRLSGQPQAGRGAADSLPCLLHMARLGERATDGKPQCHPAADPRVREEELTGVVQLLHERHVGRVLLRRGEIGQAQAETDEGERMWSGDLESFVAVDPGGEFGGGGDVAPDVRAEPFPP